jgi:hypothetical protein
MIIMPSRKENVDELVWYIHVSCTLFHAAMSLDYGSEINLSSKNELSTTFCQRGYIRPFL